MKKPSLTLVLLTLNICTAFCQEDLYPKNEKLISDFISAFKQQNRKALSNRIAYPFKVEYPLPSIKNRQEFLNRFNEVFDDSLVNVIINSTPDNDWSGMAWRGCVLLNGLVWLNRDGKLIAVNYHTAVERKKWLSLVNQDRKLLHQSIKSFEHPVCLLETKKFRIRIDDMGDRHFRYAAWSLKNSMSHRPDLIIENGIYIADGTGGNHKFDFKNEDYVYSCYITVLSISKDDPPALLSIYKADKEIVSQPASMH
jgi:hypothetical protein